MLNLEKLMFDVNNTSVSSHLLVYKGVNLEYGNLPFIFSGLAQQKIGGR